MKYSLQKRISAFVLAFALVMTTAFNSIGATTKADAAAAKVKTLYLTKKVTSATVGDSFTAQWAVRATKATKAMAKVTVKSSDTSVVKVTKTTQSKKAGTTAKKAKKTKGTATLSAVGAGEAKITITTVKKTKKKKKLSKSFTVKVAAKETPASSETPVTPSGDASKDPVAPSVESLEVEASNGLSIGETEQTVLTVKSGTKGAEIVASSVTFKSENPAVLSVDEKTGKVTGLKAGSGEVTITAQDLNGKTITKKVTITVNPLADAKITVTDASYTIKVGETVKLNPNVTPASYASALTFESSNSSVASVSADGTVKGVAAGDGVTITIKAKGTTGVATVAITVVAEGYGIASAEPVKASQIKVKFTTPISKADQSKVKFDVKLTSSLTVTASFDATGETAILTNTAGNMKDGTYTVTLQGDNLVLDANKKSVNVKVDPITATKVVIKDNKTFAPSDQIKVAYEVVDQYGDKISGYTADKLIWTLSYKDSTLNTSTPLTKTVGFANPSTDGKKANAKWDGVVYLSIGSGAGFGVNLSPVTTLNPSAQCDFTLTAYVDGKLNVNGNNTISVKKLKVEKVKVLGVTSSDALSTATPFLGTSYVSTSAQTFNILLSGADENGSAVNWQSYKASGYSNAVNVNATATKDSSCTVVTDPQITVTPQDVATLGSDVGMGKIEVPAGWFGKINISALASVDVPTADSVSSAEWIIKPTPAPSYIVWPNSISVPNKGKTVVDVTFLDQDKNPIPAPDVSAFEALTYNFNIGGVTPGTGAGISYTAKGKMTIDLGTTATVGTTGSISSSIGTFLSQPASFTVTSAAAVDKISSDASSTYNILVGETAKIGFYGFDQYDQYLKDNSSSSWGYETSKAGVVGLNANNDVDAIVDCGTTGPSAVKLAATTSVDTVSDGKTPANQGFGKLFVKGVSAGTTTVKITMYNSTSATIAGNGGIANKAVATKTITINVIETPDKFSASITNASSLKANSAVKIKIQALNATGGIVKYSGKAKVTFVEVGNAGTNETLPTAIMDASAKTVTARSTKEVQFNESGVAEFEILASKANTGNGYNYYVGSVTLPNTNVYGSTVPSTDGVDSVSTEAGLLQGQTATSTAASKVDRVGIFAYGRVAAGTLNEFDGTLTAGTAVSFTGLDTKLNEIANPLKGYKVFVNSVKITKFDGVAANPSVPDPDEVDFSKTLDRMLIFTDIDSDTGLLSKNSDETAFTSKVVSDAAFSSAYSTLGDGTYTIVVNVSVSGEGVNKTKDITLTLAKS